MPASRPRRSKAQPPGRSLVAASEKLADRLASKSGTQIGEGWQRLALDMYDAVPELRAAARITGQAMSQCRLVIARVTDGEPAPLEIGTPENPGKDADHPAQKLLEHFAGGQGGQAAWLDMLGVHLTVTGESISVGALDTTVENDSKVAEWATYSPEQVKASNRTITVKLGDSMEDDVPVREEEDGVTAVRIWRPHPRHSWRADSAARAALGAMEEIIRYDQHIESSAISRLISAGVFAVPDGMTLPGLPAADESDDVEVDPFMRFLMQVMSTAIQDRQSAAARVPILIRGDKEDIAAMKHFDFSTPFDDKVLELRNAAITRLSVAVDMPAELLTGLGSLQHWTGALVTQDWVNNYLQALMQLACGSITSGWLHKALKKQDAGGDFSDIIVWFDSSAVRVRENIGPETQWAWENGLVGDDTVRRVFGFDDSDAPGEKEHRLHTLRQMVIKAPALAPLIFPLLGITFTPEQLAQAEKLAIIFRGKEDEHAHPSDGLPRPSGPPSERPTAVPTGPGGANPTDTSTAMPKKTSLAASGAARPANKVACVTTAANASLPA